MRPRPSTPTPTAQAGWSTSPCTVRAATRSGPCWTPTLIRHWSTPPEAPPPGSGGAALSMISVGDRKPRHSTLNVRLTLGPTGWLHDQRSAASAVADPRRAVRSAVRRSFAARSEARGGAPRTGGDRRALHSMWPREPRGQSLLRAVRHGALPGAGRRVDQRDPQGRWRGHGGPGGDRRTG